MSTVPEMPCAEFVERVTDYLEGALSPADLRRLEDHLATCDPCNVYLEQLNATLQLAGELREDDVSPDMRERLVEVFTRWRDSG